MNCGISKYSVSACHLKHITRKEDIKIICKDDLKLLQQRIGKSSLHLFIVNENEFTTIMYKKYSTGGGITRSRLPSSSHSRVRSSQLRIQIFNLLAQLAMSPNLQSSKLWAILKSSVFTFKILSFFQSSFFTRANLQTSQKPGYPPVVLGFLGMLSPNLASILCYLCS